MESLYFSAPVEPNECAALFIAAPIRATSWGSFFHNIPPERRGLDGEYDHNGLAKRVNAELWQQFQFHELSNLQIEQRGAIILLLGHLADSQVLQRLLKVVLQVDGVIGVEMNGRILV